MKKIITFIALTLFLSSCVGIKGNGNVKYQDREVTDFDKIDISGAFNVVIKQDVASSLSIETDENLLEHIQSSVSRNKLTVSSSSIAKYSKLTLYIGVKEISGIQLSGACNLESKGTLRSEDLDIDVSGASEINLILRAEDISIDLSGASEVKLKGVCKSLDIDASGASQIDALELSADDCKIDASGAGEIDVFVNRSLEIDASGASEIRYKGDPKKINQESSGASDIAPY